MGNVSLIVYVAVAVLVLFLISHSPKNHPNHRHRHRRLKLRSSFHFSPDRHEPVAFDPLVAHLERGREDKQWERQYIKDSHPELASRLGDSAPAAESPPGWESFAEDEDYLNDDVKFNVTRRLLLLFPKIDVDPADGFICEKELVDWNMQLAEREVLHRTRRELETHDKNRDGFVSFAEYDPPGWVRNSDNSLFGYDMGWWKEEHFNASDFNGDGRLNLTEFNDFLHPADSKNPKLLLWLCKEEVRERDSDKDGKVSFEEFFHGLFDLVRTYDDETQNASLSDDSRQAPARRLFAELDKDNDRYLSDVELLSIIGKLHPSEHYYAKQQADYIISQADSNKDGRLTLTEMMGNPYAFYSAIFNDDEDNDDYHNEFS